MFENSTINKALTCIKNDLKSTLKNKYDVEGNKVVNDILKIHGLHKTNFDFVANLESMMFENLNDVSIDDNSNKNSKTIGGLQQEVTNSVNKLIGYRALYRQMKTMYGKEEAKKLACELYDYSLIISDATKINLPYCWSIDASRIVVEGRNFGQLHSSPAKRISSYIAQICETVHQLSSHLAGAIAVGTLFLDMSHLLMFKEGVSISELKNEATRKRIGNEFQQFIHSVNHLSRNGVESPFTNISIFDKPKLKSLLNEDNYEWYFDNDIYENNFNYSKDEIIDYIIEVQNIYLDIFDKGDPLKDGMNYRFPVTTANFSKKLVDDTYEIEDKESLHNFIVNRNIFRYNIFSSEGTKVSSCCRLISDSEMLELGGETNSFGGTSVSLGSHRVVTINFTRLALETNSEAEFLLLLDQRIESAGKVLKAHKALIQDLTDKGLHPFISNGWIKMERLFSTFGVLGEYEADVIMKAKYKNKDKDYMEIMLKRLNSKVASVSKELEIFGNIEQIPAESQAVKTCNIDKLIYSEEEVPFNLYSNQFIPLWSPNTIFERLEKDGKYNALLTGGGIVHITTGEAVTSKQAEKLINYAVDAGCEHFSINPIFSKCTNEHYTLGKNTKCPECNADIVDYYSRIVGFFIPISSANKVRREWEFEHRTLLDPKNEV